MVRCGCPFRWYHDFWTTSKDLAIPLIASKICLVARFDKNLIREPGLGVMGKRMLLKIQFQPPPPPALRSLILIAWWICMMRFALFVQFHAAKSKVTE